MSDESTRHIAYAISDLAAEQVREKWRYLHAWTTLRASGVPALLLRHVLDLEAVSTEARRVVDEWTHLGSRGLLAIVGAQDCGKSDAQVRWALQRHREGLSTMWIHAVTWGRLGFGSRDEPNEIAALLRKAEKADALIIDDVGAGDTQGSLFKTKMRGLILERGQRPTMISGNVNKAELMLWLGSQIESRLHETGRVHHIPSSLEMRKDDGVIDDLGRSPAWFAARKMVDYFGCERSLRYVDGEYVESFDIGGQLADALKRMPHDNAIRKLRETADRMGAGWPELVAVAKRLWRIEELAQSGLIEAAKGLLDSMVLQPMEPPPKPKLDTDRPMGAPPLLGKPARWATGDGARRSMHAAGFRVKRRGEVFTVLYRESVLHPGVVSEHQGWVLAAGMTAPLACGACGSTEQCEHGGSP